MIKSLTLSNFQSHEYTDLEFKPGVNVIIGSSNTGKSALMRALFWVINNRPTGIQFVSHWNQNKNGEPLDNTEVELVVNEDDAVTRIRGKHKGSGFNGYLINGKSHEAIRTDVPEEVTKLLNMTDINIQRQMDGPFLLSESSAEVARYFNGIIHLDIIDTVLAEAEKQRRALGQSVVAEQANGTRIKAQIEELSWLEEAQALLAKAEKVNARIVETRDNKDEIEISITVYQKAVDSIALGSLLVSCEKDVDIIESLNASLNKRFQTKRALTEAVYQYNVSATSIQKSTVELALEISVSDALTLDSEIVTSLQSLDALKETVTRFKASKSTIEHSNKLLNLDSLVGGLLTGVETWSRLNSAIVQYKTIQDNNTILDKTITELIAQLPETCPTCGQPFPGGSNVKTHVHGV